MRQSEMMCNTIAFNILPGQPPKKEIWAWVTSKIAWFFPCSDLHQRQADFDAKSCPDCAQDCVLGIHSSGDPTARVQGGPGCGM